MYKSLAVKRLNIKKKFLESISSGQDNAIGKFLSAIAYNVSSATHAGRFNEYKETKNLNTESDDSLSTSSWVPELERTDIEVLDNTDVYKHKLGFNSKSNPINCHGFDAFIHCKNSCMRQEIQGTNYFCTTCLPQQSVVIRVPENEDYILTEGKFECKKCSLTVKSKYNIRRHIQRMHNEDNVSPDNDDEAEKERPSIVITSEMHDF